MKVEQRIGELVIALDKVNDDLAATLDLLRQLKSGEVVLDDIAVTGSGWLLGTSSKQEGSGE